MSESKRGLVERLDEDAVICAEGYLFELERRGYLQAGAFVPEVVLEFPEAVKQLHREFVRAGSDVIEALTGLDFLTSLADETEKPLTSYMSIPLSTKPLVPLSDDNSITPAEPTSTEPNTT